MNLAMQRWGLFLSLSGFFIATAALMGIVVLAICCQTDRKTKILCDEVKIIKTGGHNIHS